MAALFETGFFVKQPAWHQEGIVLEEAPDTKEAFIISGLNWKVEKFPLFYRGKRRAFNANLNAIVRTKDHQVYGYVKEQYQLFQNEDAFNWCSPLVNTKFWNYETAGSLIEGRSCWILLKQAEKEIIKGDKLKQYLLVNWDHSGSKANIIQPTTIRVVCNNTLRMALSEKGAMKILHTRNMMTKYHEIKEYYLKTTKLFNKQETIFKRMLDNKMTDGEIEKTIDILFPINNEAKGKALTISKNTNNLIKDFAFNQASGLNELNIKNTEYGTFMAISEVTEHILGGKRIKDRGWNILHGQGGVIVERAFDFINNKIYKKAA